jgi:hypothetical protein
VRYVSIRVRNARVAVSHFLHNDVSNIDSPALLFSRWHLAKITSACDRQEKV